LSIVVHIEQLLNKPLPFHTNTNRRRKDNLNNPLRIHHITLLASLKPNKQHTRNNTLILAQHQQHKTLST
jgi:hypothetical protein